MIDPNNIVSKEILVQEEEFSVKKIFKNVRAELMGYFDDNEDEIFKFVKEKVDALWEANVLTYTGYSYYKNI